MTQGTEQPIRIETLAQAGGPPIEGAECQLSNHKGAAFAISGQSATVRRSGGNLTVRCTLDGQPPASARPIYPLNATALYSPELKRIVQFDIEARDYAGLSRETIQLRRIIRN